MTRRLVSTCPLCRTHASRVPRHLLDRLRALFVPALRYRCDNLACSWQGLLRRNPQPVRAGGHRRQPRYAPHRVLEPARNALDRQTERG
jgi:hypothetical protein